jgi:hydroxymethylpyrimidine pyrophosphatase-like HAD family hydrolase
LKKRGENVLAVGKDVIATQQAYLKEVQAVIAEKGLEYHAILNKDSLMVLPKGIDKGSGLKVLLQRMGVPRDRVVGVGDAENDEPLLDFCAVGVAVSNSLPALKQKADWVTGAANGAGVTELIDRLVADDLSGLGKR